MKPGVGGSSFLRQVALWGRVEDKVGQQLAGVRVDIADMPESFSVRVKAARDRHGAGWERAEGRPDRTVSKADGSFFFADLPPGDYSIRGEVRLVDRTEGRLIVLRGEYHGISIVWVEEEDPRMEGRKRIEMAKVTLVLAPVEKPGHGIEGDPAPDVGRQAGKGRKPADERVGNRK